MARSVLESIKKDLQYRHILSLRDLTQAYRAGFSGMFYYKLKRANIPFADCLPDFRYWSLHPINNRFTCWIDDKLTFKYVFSPFTWASPGLMDTLGAVRMGVLV